MNRLIAFFFAFLLPAMPVLTIAAPAPEPTYPQVEKVLRPSKSGLVTDLDKAFVRGLLGTPGIATASDAAPRNFVFWGDSFAAGVSGQIPWPTQFRANFRRGEFQNRGVGGETSILIKQRFDAMPSLWTSPTIICAGRNNYGDGGVQAKADIDGMVASLASVGNFNFLIIGITNADGESVGTANYNKMLAFHALLSATYGPKFLDIRPYLVAAFNPSLTQDVTDHGNDIVPTSLRAPGDPLHLNTAGNAIYQAQAFVRWSTLYPIPDVAVTMSNLEAILAMPWDRQVPYWMTSANGIFAVSNTGLRISTNGSITTTQNGDGFQIHGIFYGDGQTDLGGSASPFWWNRAFFKTTVRSPLFEAHPVSGTNTAGNSLTLAGGRSNGSGAPGVINLQTSPAGASGSAQNALVTALQVDGDNTPENFRFLLFDITAGTSKRVSRGEPNSGGDGYRLIRVPN